MRIVYAVSEWCRFVKKGNNARSTVIPLWLTKRLYFLHRLLKELTEFCSSVLLIRIAYPNHCVRQPGQTMISEAKAIPTLCRPVCLIFIRTVLLTNTYLVLFRHIL